jgi:glycosyltransferase involved in cell wall biosynthesis
MYKGLRVAVVVPAFNEEPKVAGTIAGIPGYVDHVLVVDDASRDRTFLVAAAQGRRGLEVLRHRKNHGVGAAIATGYHRALHLRSDVTCVMAGDGQMDPADLPALLDPIHDGSADYVKGNRFAGGEVWRVMPWTRLVGNIALSLLTRVTSGYRHIFDSQCGFTAASRRALLAIEPKTVFPRYGYPNDLLARLNAADLRVLDVPVRPVYGPGWRSGISLKTVIYPISYVLLRSLVWRLLFKARRHLSRRACAPLELPTHGVDQEAPASPAAPGPG